MGISEPSILPWHRRAGRPHLCHGSPEVRHDHARLGPPRTGPVAPCPALARVLVAWLDSVLALYGERILAVDLSTASRWWSRLSGALGHEGADLLIAATALEHGLTVVTRDVRYFEPTGVSVLDSLVPRG